MARRSILAFVVSVVTLLGVTLWAQTRRDPTAPTTAPVVISGENVGVRLTGGTDKNGSVRGTLVVKVDGRWVDVASPLGLVPVGK
jgi:hypothetical protein